MKGKLDNRAQFFLVVVLAAFLGQLPVVSWPFLWLTTYFYEISQCLTVSLTGGQMESLVLHWDGTGSCETHRGINWLKAMMGYPGMVAFGMLSYFTVGTLNPKKGNIAAGVLLLTVLGSLFLFSRNFAAGIILSLLAILIICLFFWRRKLLMRIVFKVLGIALVSQSIAAPFMLIRHPSISSDAIFLSQVTHLPAIIFGFGWVCFGIFGLQYLWRFHRLRGW